MNRYQQMFKRLEKTNEGAFVPFVTVGDPNLELSLNVIEALVEGGADALELGFPFSDPVADGPTIQEGNLRSLNAGTTPPLCLDIIKKIRQRHPNLPIGLLLYANLVYSNGIDHFYSELAEAGVDSLLIGDVPTVEAEEYQQTAKKYGIDSIFMVPPDASDATILQIARLGSGYTYLVSRTGTTGTESKAGKPVGHLLEQLQANQASPALLGFGISEPEQVKAAIEAGAAGAISGSAVVKLIEQNLSDPERMCDALRQFTQRMKAATAR
ncbi:MAG: Tryptophan synthase alpha chain [Candidatus Celerinatantimonas neptuna]|nr:MAG: Tryptophan synthase alpha chain [Candidatus Celerinatantimonas neptuna]